MIVYRLSKLIYASDLSGFGASLSSTNRWNSKGVEMLYTASNRSLAFAEVLAHLNRNEIPLDLAMVSLKLPRSSKFTEAKLNKDHSILAISETQEIGNQFIDQKFQFALRVPSFAVQGEYNILLNPHHPDMQKVQVEDVQPFTFDSRFFTGSR